MAKTYNFNEVIVSYIGVPLGEYADGDDAIQISFQEDQTQLTMGADNEGMFTEINNFSALITFRLMHTSALNDFMEGALIERPRGGGLVINDLNGHLLYASQDARVQKIPDSSMGTTAGSRDWAILTDNLQPGNAARQVFDELTGFSELP